MTDNQKTLIHDRRSIVVQRYFAVHSFINDDFASFIKEDVRSSLSNYSRLYTLFQTK